MTRISSESLNRNFYAFALAILKNCTPEMAFMVLDGTLKSCKRNDITEEDLKDMIIMKERGLTYKEIGEIYCMKEGTVFKKIKRYYEKSSMKKGA